MRNRKQNKFNIKDYIVPIITFVLIFILIYIAIGGSSDENDLSNSNNYLSTETNKNSSINISFGNEKTLADIIKINKEKIKARNDSKLQDGEIIVVNKGFISINLSDIAKISLNGDKGTGRLKYISNSKIELIASSLWVKTNKELNVKLKFGHVKIGANSIVNLRQTEASTSAYLIKGSTEFVSKSSNTFLSPGKKIEITYNDFNKDDIDLNILKDNFDDNFRIRDWTVQNNGGLPLTNIDLSKNEDEKSSENLLTNTGTINKIKNNISTSSSLLDFDGIYDEGFVNTPKTNISGSFIDDSIFSITINGKSANINMDKKTFNVIGINTSNKVNDLVIKIFNETNDLIGKSILTLNYKSGSNENNTNLFSEINTQSYPVNKSDFTISIPTVKQGKTFSSENTFYGIVKNPNVAAVKVNGYKLKTYNGRTFRYHAYKKFKTLGEGVNNYKIEYIGKDGKTILIQYKTIEKLSKKAISKKKISGEAQ